MECKKLTDDIVEIKNTHVQVVSRKDILNKKMGIESELAEINLILAELDKQ